MKMSPLFNEPCCVHAPPEAVAVKDISSLVSEIRSRVDALEASREKADLLEGDLDKALAYLKKWIRTRVDYMDTENTRLIQ